MRQKSVYETRVYSPLPKPISVGWNKKRKFLFKDVSAFLEQLNKAK